MGEQKGLRWQIHLGLMEEASTVEDPIAHIAVAFGNKPILEQNQWRRCRPHTIFVGFRLLFTYVVHVAHRPLAIGCSIFCQICSRDRKKEPSRWLGQSYRWLSRCLTQLVQMNVTEDQAEQSNSIYYNLLKVPEAMWATMPEASRGIVFVRQVSFDICSSQAFTCIWSG